jgi:outer membrane protein TolC
MRGPVVAAALALLPLAAFAQNPPLHLTAAVDRILEVHPQLDVAWARQAESSAAVGEARVSRGPVVSARLSGLQYDDPMAVSPIHGFAPDQLPGFDETLLQGAIDIGFTLFDSGERRARLRQAEELERESVAGLSETRQQLVARVVLAFVDVQTRAEVLAAERGRLEAFARERQRAALRLEAGKAPELESLRAEAALAGADAAVVTAAAELDVAERELARLLDLDPEQTRAARLQPLVLVESGDSTRPAELESAALTAAPAMERARRRLAAAEAGQSLARSAWFPRLGAVASLQHFGDSDLEFTSDWSAGLKLAVPIWNGATARRLARARAGKEAALAAVADTALAVRSRLDRALAARLEAEARAQALGRAAAQLAEVARVEQLRHEVGAGTQVDYLAAVAELAATRARQSEAAAAALAARVELARLTGQIGPEWIRRTFEEQP